MSLAQRLARLEGSLSPRAIALLWLEEAHTFASLPAYVRWLAEQPLDAAPLVRVPAAIETALRTARRGQPRTAVEEAVQQAVRDGVFLVELVIGLNVMAARTIERASLQIARLAVEAQLLASEGTTTSVTSDRRRAWIDALASVERDLQAQAAGRAELEHRFLDRHGALFADTAADWDRLLQQVTTLAPPSPSMRIANRRRRQAVDPGTEPTTEATNAWVTQRVDDARAATLERLGDAAGARAIVGQHLPG